MNGGARATPNQLSSIIVLILNDYFSGSLGPARLNMGTICSDEASIEHRPHNPGSLIRRATFRKARSKVLGVSRKTEWPALEERSAHSGTCLEIGKRPALSPLCHRLLVDPMALGKVSQALVTILLLDGLLLSYGRSHAKFGP